MPCNDHTEVLDLRIDNNAIISFDLNKMSCGRSVGSALLLPFIQNQPTNNILTHGVRDFIPHIDMLNTADQFLLEKQYSALQIAIRAIEGSDTCGKDDCFALESIDYFNDSIELSGILSIHWDTKKIDPCCGEDGKTCGSSAPDVICTCMDVHRQTILDAIEGGAKTISDLQEQNLAGSGCQSCHPELENLLSSFTI